MVRMVGPLCDALILRVTKEGQATTVIDHVSYLVNMLQDKKVFRSIEPQEGDNTGLVRCLEHPSQLNFANIASSGVSLAS